MINAAIRYIRSALREWKVHSNGKATPIMLLHLLRAVLQLCISRGIAWQ
eukprot:CAMPEP_0184386530 /NCGR_PEP_ID=MMETSP0007-20130409/9864_1 /TAXON_ID=97485 /ORGANISM="Prymnesium parvum, Strain Texoma1" /LENGTH=48 /DNA_ID= /DNA_START= /DNA_END= /DNA_ORIENTATION=